MRATLENLVFRFLNTPLKDFVRHNPLVVLGSAVALAALGAGVYYATKALRNAFCRQAAGPAPGVNAAAQKTFSRPPVVNFCPKIRAHLDNLFTGTPYSSQSLPTYPHVLNEQDNEIQHNLMDGPVVKGITSDKRVFIAIKVNRHLTDQDIQQLKLPVSAKKELRDAAELEQLIVIGQYLDGIFMWDQFNRGERSFLCPNFFTGNFTDPDNGDLLPGQTRNFQLLKTLLQKGSGPDVNGVVWKVGASPTV